MKVKSKIFYWYAAFVVAFGLLTLLPSPDKVSMQRYHLSSTSIRLLDLTLIIPEALIWFVAFYGYQKLSRYASLIRSDKDGSQIFHLARGLLLLAVGLPIAAILSTILNIIASHVPDFKPSAVVINNYCGILFPLWGFLLMSIGARGLGNLAKTRPRFTVLNAITLAVIILGVGFCCLVSVGHTAVRNTYHMSPGLVMLTLGVPYMYTWFLGLLTIAELHAYSHTVPGVLYRRGWMLLIWGLGSIILTYITIEYLSTLSTWITSLSLGGILALLYVLLLLLAGAFIVVALGAKKLTKIEEA